MMERFGISLADALLAGYVLCALCLNCIMFLVSSFYQRKFRQVSPRAGFMITILLGALFIGTIFFRDGSAQLRAVVQSLLLLVGSITSGFNSIALYSTMKKVSK
jgi:hypothetical protein